MRQANRIIEAVKERPHLYSQQLQNSKYIGIKNRNWLEVAKIVYGREDKATVNRVKIQWKSLRDAFVKHQRKLKNATTKIRPYIYEEEMHFLLPHILSKDREDFGESIPLQNFEVKAEDCSNLTTSWSGGSHVEDTEIEIETVPRMEATKNGISWEQNAKITEKSDNPIDAFFYGIAQTVKQLKPATAAKLKKAVAALVMDAELREIEEAESQKNKSLTF